MLVNVELLQAYCRVPADCGLALGCLGPDDGCGPCSSDKHCGEGEACVLDHCLASQRARCRTYHDRKNGSVCILSGISSDPRGNAEMSSLCSDELENRPESEVPAREPREKHLPAVGFETLQRRIQMEGGP